jgi:AcrR family transcriptional regulator
MESERKSQQFDKSSAKPVETRRQRKYRQRREAIIEAARKVFERKGFAGASIEEIASEADFAKGSIYYYFANKGTLLEAVFGDETARVARRFREIATSDRIPTKRLGRLIEESLDFYERNFALFRIVIAPMGMETAKDGDGLQSLRARHLEMFQEERNCLLAVIQDGQRTGAITDELDAEEASDLLRGLLNSEVARWDRRGRKGKLKSRSATILRIFLHGLSCGKDTVA